MEEIIFTNIGKNYWNNEGAYDDQFKALTKELMPDSGEATTLQGELVRAANRLYYEYFNNGNCNACDATCIEDEEGHDCPDCNGEGGYEDEETGEWIECEYCGGSGIVYDEPEEEYAVSEWYGAFIELIRKHFEDKYSGNKSMKHIFDSAVWVCDNIENIITNSFITERIRGVKGLFDDKRMNVYDRLIDLVAWDVLNTPRDKYEPLPDWYASIRKRDEE